jgi:hypothetical protein
LLNYEATIPPYEPRHFRNEYESPTGQAIYALLITHDAKLLMAAATYARIPALALVEPLIVKKIGPEAFTDRLKMFAGHATRHICEAMGGALDRSSVPITIKGANYKSAARYSEPGAS